jgi:hypothetical protein
LLEGTAPVTVAIHPLDPIAAAKADIEGSKSLMAAVADDLGQHERWLAHYRLAERRHARRVMLQELIYRLELARWRTMRFLRRTALLTLRLARRVASFATRTAVVVFVSVRDVVIACMDWLRPRVHALALLLRHWLVASWIWLAAESRALAALVARWSSAAWVWTRANAAILARVSQKRISIASTWIATTSLALAAAFLHWLVRTSRRTRALARVLWRKSLYGAGVASTWIAVTLREAASRFRQQFSAAWKWTAVHGRILARVRIARRSAARKLMGRRAVTGGGDRTGA